MELTAAIEGLRALREDCEVEVVTDSEYVKNGITLWIHAWKRKKWMTTEQEAGGEPGPLAGARRAGGAPQDHLDVDQGSRDPRGQQPLRRAGVRRAAKKQIERGETKVMKRSGFADLPLHGGHVPAWLAERMTKLGTAIAESILYHYGPSELLSRLSDPFWFQALGCVMGMDWHSSGITTSVLGALKRGLNPRAGELGIYVCGGRGRHSRNTPDELRTVADHHSLDGEALVRASRLTAKIDNNAIADGFQIYLHTFVLTAAGEWAVVQQGMNERSGLARRYHWHSAAVRDFTSQPHTAIVGEHQGTIMNLVDSHAEAAQQAMLAIVREQPDATLGELRKLVAPAHHDVRAADVDLEAPGRGAGRRLRAGVPGFRFAAAAGEPWPAHASSAGADRRGGSRNVHAVLGPGAILIRAGRKGPASVSGAAENL